MNSWYEQKEIRLLINNVFLQMIIAGYDENTVHEMRTRLFDAFGIDNENF